MVQGDRFYLADKQTKAVIVEVVSNNTFVIEVNERYLTGRKLVTLDEIKEGVSFTPMMGDDRKSRRKNN
jgi:hypothetical protein